MSRQIKASTQVLLTAGLFGLGAVLYLSSPIVLPQSLVWYLIVALVWCAGLLAYNLQGQERPSDRHHDTSTLVRDTLGSYLDMVFWSVDKNQRLVDVSGSALGRLVGTGEAILGKRVSEIVSPDNPIHFDLERAFRGENFVVDRAFGKHRYRTHYFTETNVLGEVTGCLCVTVDLSSVGLLDEQLSLARQIIANASDAILVADARRTVLSVNNAFTQVTGFLGKEMIGKKMIIPDMKGVTFGRLRDIALELKSSGRWEGEIEARRKSGEPYVARLRVLAICERGEISHFLTCFSDISEVKQRHDELRHLADHDFLTGLPNRRLFLDRLEQAIRRAKRRQYRFALFFVDLDRFKQINDSLGHPVGDELLKTVSQRLREVVREMDTVARLAGDEFTLIVEEVMDDGEVVAVARKVLSCFDQPFDCLGESVECWASVGIAVYPESGGSVEELMAVADSAMYRAKSTGTTGYFFLNDQHQGRRSIVSINAAELRAAIVGNQFELFYQPQIDMASGRVTGCEALLRWNHPQWGQLEPDSFLHCAGESGTICDIGAWVLDTAGKQSAAWEAVGISLERLAVNIAEEQLKDQSMLFILEQSLKRSGLRPATLNLEISLATALREPQKTVSFFHRVRSLGVGCVLDEFTPSEEGFALLSQLDVDAVKLDALFVRSSRGSRDARAMIAGLVALGQARNFKVMGVGVERQNQLAALSDSGCHFVQGFYYAKALSGQDFLTFYSTFNRCSAV